MNLAQESAQAFDGDGLHVIAVVVQLLQHGRADAPLHGRIDLHNDNNDNSDDEMKTETTTTKTTTTTAADNEHGKWQRDVTRQRQ